MTAIEKGRPRRRIPAGWSADRPRGCVYCPWCDHRSIGAPNKGSGRDYIYRCERRPALVADCPDYAELRAQEAQEG